MGAARCTAHPLIFKQTSKGSITIWGDAAVTNVETFRLLSLINSTVTWKGTIRENTITWYSTAMALQPRGPLKRLKKLRKTINSPSAAEKLRAEPWEIVGLVEMGPGREGIVFERGNIGRLCYERAQN